jgi:hypothetical protein
VTARPGEEEPGPEADARRLAQRLVALEEGAIRARAAARALARADPARSALVVAALARARNPHARAALAAVSRALADPRGDLPYAWLAELYSAAAERGLEEVTSLLVAPPPVRAWEAPRDRDDRRLASLTLGHRKAMARAHRDPDLLARLAAEGDPAVVRELLRNPRLTEPFVVRIASRRPCRPATLRCVWESRRWRTRPAVALALARNPYVETELALEIASGLGAGELRELARDRAVHPLVRALARRLVRERAR